MVASEISCSTCTSSGKSFMLIIPSLLLSSSVAISTEYSSEQKFTGYILNTGQTDEFFVGTSQRGRWETHGTMIMHGTMLMSGSNPSGGSTDDILIHSDGAYQLMSDGIVNAKQSNSGDIAEHGFENQGTLYSATGSVMNFLSPYSKIKNYGNGYTELNGTLNLSGHIDNSSNFVMNGALSVTSDGRIMNAGSFANNSTVDFAGTWSGTGTLTNNGTFNQNGGSFNHKIAGNGRYVYAGGSFSTPSLTNNLTLQINSGLSASIASASGANVENYGSFTLGGGFLHSLDNKANSTVWFNNSSKATSINNAGIIHTGNLEVSSLTNSGSINANGSISFKGTANNSGILNTTGIWSFAGGKLNNNGTIETDRASNIFESLGAQGRTPLSTISLQVTGPEETKTALTDLFRHYVPGSVAQNLIDHAKFTGGKVIVTGVNLTQTQADDLMEAFKSKFVVFEFYRLSSFSSSWRTK
ncbi:hypothetical protein A4V04_06555 [Burkholderiales bacterium YL45]|nr:hypothetical protein A4V04_06555 [Burkholderiales bacterium YL45]